MDEAAWLAAANAVEMVEALREDLGPRKLRLFGGACCRHFSEAMRHEASRNALATIEQFADTGRSKAALKRARQAVRAIRHALDADAEDNRREWVGLWLIEIAASENAYWQVAHEIQRLTADEVLRPNEQPRMADLLRCVAGNPFQKPTPVNAPADVQALAKRIQAERAFERLPELARRLRESECTDDAVLEHCASEGVHAPGCWALEAILAGKPRSAN